MASAQTMNQAGDQNPTDIIIIWTGFIATIPLGWKLCDGTLGTPDLRDRYVRGVPTNVTNPGATAGVATVTITTGQMGNHLHSGSGTLHSHNIPISDITTGFQGDMILGGNGVDVANDANDVEMTKVVNPVQTQGGDGPHNNLPTFFEVLYIQKI